jgi:DNA-binding PadR family transcriptional regulator
MARPQGAPRGMLMFYMLHRIAHKPSHGYELLQDIARISEGAWRPGAGSIYPMLKKMAEKGYIRCESEGKGETSQCVYSITPKGQEFLRKAREHLKGAGQRWGSMSRIFFEFVEPEDMPALLMGWTRLYFSIVQEVLKQIESRLSPTDLQFVLKEYALILERELNLSNKMLGDVEAKKGS